MSNPPQKNTDLEKKAVDEILKETSRAAARAEVGGSLSWRKPKHKGINKRFLNNTLLSTVIQNHKTSKPSLVTTSALKHHAKPTEHQVPDSSPVPSPVTQPDKPSQSRGGKVVISSRGRFQAYLASHKHKVEKSKAEEQKDEAGSEKDQEKLS